MKLRWPTKSLGELAGCGQYGLNAAAMSEGTGVRFVRITDITQGGELKHEEPAFVPEDTAELDNYELKDGDLLIARSGATAGKSYIHRSFGERAVFAGYLIRFQPDTSQILPRFIGAFLQTPGYWRQLNSHKRAVAQPNVNAKQLASLILPVPPLAEQVQIVKLLDEAGELRKLRARADRRMAALIPALFNDMFGNVGNGCLHLPIGQAVEEFIDYRGKTPHKSSSGIPLITAKVVKHGRILEPTEFISDDIYTVWMRRGLPRTGDVLFTMEAPLGQVAIVKDPRIALAQRILLMRPRNALLDSRYFMIALTMPFVRKQIEERATGSTVSGIRQAELRKVLLPIPALKLQKEFAARVLEIQAMQSEQSASRLSLETLFQSLLHRAFNGEL